MKTLIKPTDPVLLAGNDILLAGVTLCLLNAGHTAEIFPEDTDTFTRLLKRHIETQRENTSKQSVPGTFTILENLNCTKKYKLAIIVTPEDFAAKQSLIKRIEAAVDHETVIAINTESYRLSMLQKGLKHPERLLGLNWTEPAHTTFFLEIIEADNTGALAKDLFTTARQLWNKDPYLVKEAGIRSRLISAMAREASYLVDNGYASVEDIDRACRNDAGYYLPFSGNCRYMDLMGTYAYGMVMKDLNPDLSKARELPGFLQKILKEGGLGMENNCGFYAYTDKEVEAWKTAMEKFSYQIQAIIEKYPFNYNKETFTD